MKACVFVQAELLIVPTVDNWLGAFLRSTGTCSPVLQVIRHAGRQMKARGL